MYITAHQNNVGIMMNYVDQEIIMNHTQIFKAIKFLFALLAKLF